MKQVGNEEKEGLFRVGMSYMGEIYDVDVRELDEFSIAAEQPVHLQGLCLMPHQQRALHRCREMEDTDLREPGDPLGVGLRTSVGIYGDAAGTGKSHVMLSLIIGDKERLAEGRAGDALQVRVRTYADGRVKVTEADHLSRAGTTVVVIPHALTSQWEGYVRPLQSAGTLNTLIISRRKMLDGLTPSSIAEYDLILVTNSFYEDLARVLLLARVRVRRLVVDEADTIAITSSMTIPSAFTWFVTASYGNLMFPMGNTRYEPLLVHSICVAKGLVHPGFIRMLFMNLHANMSRSHFRRLIVKNSRRSVQASVQSACRGVVHEFVPSLTPHAIRVLSGIVDRVVIESLNAGDMASAVRQIAPEKRHVGQSAVAVLAETYTLKLQAVERRLRQLETAHACSSSSSSYPSQCALDAAEIQRVTALADNLRHKIECIRARVMGDDVCCICLEATVVNTVVPCCTTKMCFECITRWVIAKSSCVLCRRPLSFSDLHTIEEKAAGKDALSHTHEELPIDPHKCVGQCGIHNTKMQNLEAILRHHVRGSTLIFSNYDKSFEAICACLTEMGKTFDYLRGGNRQISNTVESYKDGRIDVLLINATHYGGGLNLENTTDLLMFHALNTEVEKQVIGRAHRMGRTSDLRVWHLLHENEMQHATEICTAEGMGTDALSSGDEARPRGADEQDAIAGALLDAAADADAAIAG